MATDYGNKSIVTDKLHYYMDPANKQSYIGSGTSAGSTVGPLPMGTLGASNVFSNDNGGIFNFDGATDYLQVASDGSTAGFNVATYTICVWVKPSNTGQTSYDTFFSYDYTAHSTPYYAIHFRGYPGNGAIILSYNAGGSYSSSTYLITGGGYMTIGEWNMYSVTFSNTGSNTYIKIYKNETQIAIRNGLAQSPPTFYNQEVWLGKANFASGQYDGGYGPCMFYQKVLTQEEIAHNYNILKSRFE